METTVWGMTLDEEMLSVIGSHWTIFNKLLCAETISNKNTSDEEESKE